MDYELKGADDIEYRTAEEIARYQDERLRETIGYVVSRSPFYGRMFARLGLNPDSIRTVDDLAKLPFTTKRDLQRNNTDFMCVPTGEIIDYVTTSGTLGEPVVFGCTEGDLRRLAYNEHKSFASAGVTRDSVVQLMTTMDKRFMAGMAYFLGVRSIGAGIVRVGGGMPALQWDTILRLKPDTLMCVPSFILKLIDYAEKNGIDYRKSSVKRIIGIGESLRNDADLSLNLLGQRIRDKWDVELYCNYSSTEMAATFAECPCGCGGHLHPELVIAEIVDEEGRRVADGELGEVVITTLGIEGMPLLRFRTGDISRKLTSRCACGRNSYRLGPIAGRKNNMLKLKGTTLYPPAIYDVLDHTPYVENYVVIATTDAAGTDAVTVTVGLKPEVPVNAERDLRDRFRSVIRVAPAIEISTPELVNCLLYPADNRKPVKFIDRRTS